MSALPRCTRNSPVTDTRGSGVVVPLTVAVTTSIVPPILRSVTTVRSWGRSHSAGKRSSSSPRSTGDDEKVSENVGWAVINPDRLACPLRDMRWTLAVMSDSTMSYPTTPGAKRTRPRRLAEPDIVSDTGRGPKKSATCRRSTFNASAAPSN